MKELFKLLRDCATLSMSISYLQSKKNKSLLEREQLKFKKEVMPVYLRQLKKMIEKNIED